MKQSQPIDENETGPLEYMREPTPRRRPLLRLLVFLLLISVVVLLIVLDVTRLWPHTFLVWASRSLYVVIPFGAVAYYALEVIRRPEKYSDEDKGDRVDLAPKPSPPLRIRYAGGTLGIGASTFSGLEIGCGGAMLFVLLIVGAIFSMLGMVWWVLFYR